MKISILLPYKENFSPNYPGAVSLFEEIADKFGNLGLKELCKQPIRYAEEGVVVSPRVSFDWYTHKKKLTGASEKFYLDSGKAYKAGSLFKAPMQAEVLRQIAAHGSKGFYESDVTIQSEHGNFSTTISMNQPLRYKGDTFFQASFSEDELSTVFQVVKNP